MASGRASFRDGRGRFAAKSSKGVRVYRNGKRLTGKARRKELQSARKPKTKSSFLTDFPKGYTSPFRFFITPVSRARAPERAFALVEIVSRKKYEGTAFTNWVPLDLGYQPPDIAREITEADVTGQYKLSGLSGKNSLSKIFGIYMLKTEEARRRALTPRLLNLIKYRAKYGNEKTKALPKRPKKKRKK